MNSPHEFANLDFNRAQRTGMNETIFCPGKNLAQLAEICRRFHEAGQAVLGSRCTAEQFEHLHAEGLPVRYDEVARLLYLGESSAPPLPGHVAICSGGTADIPVAEEAAAVAAWRGAEVRRYYDVGVAGIHRLLNRVDDLREADVIIAVAGMEGALPSVVAGLVSAPVIALPTSVGYGASFQGLAPLLTMLNSCAEGISVVNIDNGYGAGVLACRMLQLIQKHTATT